MATFNTSGATQDGNTPYYMAVTWNETAVDTLNNRSTVTIKAVASGGSSSYYSYWRNNTFKVTDQSGNVLVNKSNAASTQYFNGDTVWEATFTVNHVSTTGAASITVALSSGVYNASNITKATQTLNLTTIARASTISVADNLNITANSGNLAVSIVSKGNYYHKLQYRFNGTGSWVNLSDKNNVNNTTETVNLPVSTILAGIVTSRTGTVNFQLLTYTSSDETTQVGATQSDSTSITIDISKAALQPVVSTLTAAAASGNKISGYVVAGYDKATITFATTKAPGGSSSGYKVTTYFSINQGFTMATKSTASVSGTVNTNTAPASESNKTVTVSAYAVDSRGATSATKTTTFTCRGYSTPIITANFFRCVSNTDKTADEAGLGATGTFSTAVGNSVDSKNTIQSTTCKYAKNGSGSTTFTSGYAFAIAESDTITFTITTTDKVTSITKTYTIPSAIYPIDLYQGTGNDASKVGLGIGRIAVANRVVSSKYIVVGPEKTDIDDGKIGGLLPGDGTLRLTSSGASAVYFYAGLSKKVTGGVLSNDTGSTYLREYCKDSDSSDFTGVYENYWLPAPTAGRSGNARYEILTTKGTVEGGSAVLPVSNGGTGVQSLSDVTVGHANVAYRTEAALAGKSGTTTTNRWYKIGTCTIYGANADMTTVIVVSCPYGSYAHGGAQWGIARIKLRSGASGAGMTASSCHLEWLASNNLAPANFKLLIDTASTDNTRVNELWVYAAGSYQTWTVAKITEAGRSTVQANGSQGWKFTNNYAAEGASAVTSGLTNVAPTFAQSNMRNLYNNATGTTDTVTLSETAADFTYLDIYYYTSHGSGSTPKRMSHIRVYDPDGQNVALTNTVYWSNELLISQSQIHISGTSITRLSNEQAQFKLTTSAASRTATTTNIYIYRVDGYR